MDETVEKTENGAILYDRAVINHISPAGFDPASWRESELVRGDLRSAGRGAAYFLRDDRGEFALRHYRRGGLPGRFVSDRYLWRGEDRTRSFREWRLLAELWARGLPVPRPAAARYRRHGWYYTADLITVRKAGIRPLSARLREPATPAFWTQLGRALRRFHDAGACHADLNAYNLQLDDHDELFLLDFDRGELREAGAWRQRNLARLRRSLSRVSALDPAAVFSDGDWDALLAGYREVSRSA